MNVCMHVYMSVPARVCAFVCECMPTRKFVSVDACMHVCMYVCVHVCVRV